MNFKRVAGAVLMLGTIGSVPGRASLLSYWNFNESGGGTAHDSAGSVNGTLQGSSAFVAGGVQGNAISISGAGSLVNMGDNFNFNNGSAYSLQAWVKLAAGDTGGYIPVGRHHATFVQGYFLALNDVTDGCGGTNKAHFYTDYPCSPNSSITTNDGTWHQVVGTFQGGVASLYVDGVFQGASSGVTLNQLNGVPFLVGGVVFGSTPTNTYSGLIDNVAVWDNVLSATEVRNLFQAEGDPTVPEPGSIGLVLIGTSLLLGYGRRRTSNP